MASAPHRFNPVHLATASVEDLQDRERFAAVWELDHLTVARSLQPYIWRRSWGAALYIAANVAALVTVAVEWARSGVGRVMGFPLVCLGMAIGYIFLLPVHEAVHAIAYRAMGARVVVVRYQWRSLTAYCAADRYVVGRRGLTLVCLAPFLSLNPPLAVSALLANGSWSLVAAGAFLLHVGACSGDFGMVNWLWIVGSADVLSYDDVAAGRTHFIRPVHAAHEASSATTN